MMRISGLWEAISLIKSRIFRSREAVSFSISDISFLIFGAVKFSEDAALLNALTIDSVIGSRAAVTTARENPAPLSTSFDLAVLQIAARSGSNSSRSLWAILKFLLFDGLVSASTKIAKEDLPPPWGPVMESDRPALASIIPCASLLTTSRARPVGI